MPDDVTSIKTCVWLLIHDKPALHDMRQAVNVITQGTHSGRAKCFMSLFSVDPHCPQGPA